MRVEAEIKQVGEPYEGHSKTTGKAWKAITLLLEWKEGEDTNRAWATMFNDVVEWFEQTELQVGEWCVANLLFSTRSYRTGYHKTEVNINDITRRTTV